MSTSEAGWLKKFLGENPNEKALRERLEEATALLTSKEEALAALQQRLTESVSLAERETGRILHLEARIQDLTSIVAETDLSRNVTEELLKQAEAQNTQKANALSAEREKFVTANQAKLKAETSVKALMNQVQRLEKQGIELRANLSRTEQEREKERAASAETLQSVQAELTRVQQQHELASTHLAESRAEREKLDSACLVNETKARQLAAQLKETATHLDQREQELARCRLAFWEMMWAAIGTVEAALGRAAPVALRVAMQAGAVKPMANVARGATAHQCLSELKRYLTDAGIDVSTATSPKETLLELKGDGFGAIPDAARVIGAWFGYWSALSLTAATETSYELAGVQATGDGVRISLRAAATPEQVLSAQ